MSALFGLQSGKRKYALGANFNAQPSFLSGWTTERCNLTPRIATRSPNGDNTAARLFDDGTATNTHNLFRNISFAVANVPHIASVFFRNSTGNLARRHLLTAIYDSGFAGAIQTAVNSESGAVIYGGISYGTNFIFGTSRITRCFDGWWEVSQTFTPSVDTSLNFYCSLLDAGTNATYSGDSTSGIDLWGACLRVL